MRALERRIARGEHAEFEKARHGGGSSPIYLLPRAKRRRGTRLYSYAVAGVSALIGTTAVLGIAGAPTNGANLWGSERRALTAAAETLLKELAANDLEAALAVFPEGKAGPLVDAEERRVFGASRTLERNAEERMDELRALRADLSSQGVQWDDIQLAAFAGTRARVSDDAQMAHPITALTGEICFQSDGRLYAIELSAWRCDGRYVIMDIWQAREVSKPLSELKAESLDRSEALRLGAVESNSTTQIEFPRHLYYEFRAP